SSYHILNRKLINFFIFVVFFPYPIFIFPSTYAFPYTLFFFATNTFPFIYLYTFPYTFFNREFSDFVIFPAINTFSCTFSPIFNSEFRHCDSFIIKKYFFRCCIFPLLTYCMFTALCYLLRGCCLRCRVLLVGNDFLKRGMEKNGGKQ